MLDDNVRINIRPTALVTTTMGHFMPPEWPKQAAVWMAWPHMRSVWSRHCKLACPAIINLIFVIARYQMVKLLVRAEDLSGVRHCLPVEWDMISVCALYNDIWVRNTGPMFLQGGGC